MLFQYFCLTCMWGLPFPTSYLGRGYKLDAQENEIYFMNTKHLPLVFVPLIGCSQESFNNLLDDEADFLSAMNDDEDCCKSYEVGKLKFTLL